MGEEYERRRGVEDVEGLGEDGPIERGGGGEVNERGLFGRHGKHGHSSGYGEGDEYTSEIGGGYGRRPPPWAVSGYGGEEEAYAAELGGSYGRRPPPRAAMYEGEGGYGGGYGSRPPPEVVYVEGGAPSGYGGGAYADESGYGRRPPPPMYANAPAETSDLGTGLMDSNIRAEPDYGSGYGPSDLTNEYVDRGRHGVKHGGRLSSEDRKELEEERDHKHYAEAAAAAALGYGLYERHERSEAEDRLEELGYDSDGKKKHDHHRFRSD